MDTKPTVTSPSCTEKSPLLASGAVFSYTHSSAKEAAAADEGESADREDLLTSEQHKAKDFQLIHVPKGAVSEWINSSPL